MPSFTVFKGDKNGKIVKDTATRPDLTRDQILVRITASGLCGTDVHARNAPMDVVLGHEGAGVVEATGPDVGRLKKGDRVGWGYVFNACGHCQYCLSGREIFCPDREIFLESNFDIGSMASHCVIRESFLYTIPEGMSDQEAAPLMCGGATTFSALFTQGVLPTSRVGIIGIGGLGHLAIQFANKMGCEVVVFSGSESKKEEAIKLGASHFIATKGKSDLTGDLGSIKLDFLVVTASITIDWNLYIPALAPQCKIIPLTVTDQDFVFPQQKMILYGYTVQGTMIANRPEHRLMLEFAARHGIKPLLNEFPLTEQGIEEAFDVMAKGKMKYRGVLVAQ